MSRLLKRFRPKSTGHIDELEPSPQQSNTSSFQAPETTEKYAASSPARNIQGAETNRRLAAFERAHRWDLNLGDEQLDDIDDAVNAHDPNSESRIYDGVVENSPYPEVSRTFSSYLLLMTWFGVLYTAIFDC